MYPQHIDLTPRTEAVNVIDGFVVHSESNLEIGNPEDWEEEYPNKLQGGETMTVFYKVDEENEEIEFAISAKTTNWVAFGLRASGDRNNPGEKEGGKEKKKGDKKGKKKKAEGEVEGEEEGEGEGAPGIATISLIVAVSNLLFYK